MRNRTCRNSAAAESRARAGPDREVGEDGISEFRKWTLVSGGHVIRARVSRRRSRLLLQWLSAVSRFWFVLAGRLETAQRAEEARHKNEHESQIRKSRRQQPPRELFVSTWPHCNSRDTGAKRKAKKKERVFEFGGSPREFASPNQNELQQNFNSEKL